MIYKALAPCFRGAFVFALFGINLCHYGIINKIDKNLFFYLYL